MEFIYPVSSVALSILNVLRRKENISIKYQLVWEQAGINTDVAKYTVKAGNLAPSSNLASLPEPARNLVQGGWGNVKNLYI